MSTESKDADRGIRDAVRLNRAAGLLMLALSVCVVLAAMAAGIRLPVMGAISWALADWMTEGRQS